MPSPLLLFWPRSWRSRRGKAGSLVLSSQAEAAKRKRRSTGWKTPAWRGDPGSRARRVCSCWGKCKAYRPPFRKMTTVGTTEASCVCDCCWFFCTFSSLLVPISAAFLAGLHFLNKSPSFPTCGPDQITAPNPDAGGGEGRNKITLIILLAR